jgi:hypothetical protein
MEEIAETAEATDSVTLSDRRDVACMVVLMIANEEACTKGGCELIPIALEDAGRMVVMVTS